MNRDIFKHIEKSGVVYVMEEAAKCGFTYNDHAWSNLGQGAPETGELFNGCERLKNIQITEDNSGYLPIAGQGLLREKISNLYNDLFRKEKSSIYSKNNVSIGGGGRLVLSRIALTLQNVNLLYFLPEYASYEGIIEMISGAKYFPFELSSKNNFEVDLDELENFLKEKNINVMLLSNPSNPTGNVISGERLESILRICKQNKVLLIIDEFYFNFIYNNDLRFESIARYIEEIENENVIIVSGHTKGWRYPGWRLAWAIGPEKLIQNLNNVASFLDGGANSPLQYSAVDITNTNYLIKETEAIRNTFVLKRNIVINKLKEVKLKISSVSNGAFYIWVNLSELPNGINQDIKFFEECLKEKVIVVPGRYFDINPFKQRMGNKFENFVRLSYGPKLEEVEKGMNKIIKVVKRFQ